MNNYIIAISGLSGASKTTTGKALAEKLSASLIDQDEFFDSYIPEVTLSNGHKRKCYDCDTAIDIVKFNQKILKEKENHQVIVIAGFSLRSYFFIQRTQPNIHFHLTIDKELSLQTRLEVKNFSDERKADELLMFNEYVFPYYQQTLSESKIDHDIFVISNNGERRPINDILDVICEKLSI